MDQLMQDTYRPLVTQDRPCPKGTCAKTPAGCPCVKPDGDPGLPIGYVVRRVIRVEDSEMWSRYVQRREAIRRRRRHRLPLRGFEPELFTSEVVDSNPDSFEPLDKALNEVYLWHGTQVRAGLAIAQNDFDIDLSGSSAGSMLGNGVYCAESCTKADEYAKDEPDGYYKGVYAMLLCRVCMGNMFYTTKRDSEAKDGFEEGKYDSTLGDRAKYHKTFREFVVYESDQIYPEYLILYSRVMRGGNMERIRQAAARSPLQTQLPVYWSNCHKNPSADNFHAQYRVCTTTRELLEKLVAGTFSLPVESQDLEVLDARRIEHSNLWSDYVGFRSSLQERNRSRRRHCIPVCEVDSKVSDAHALTHCVIQELHGEDVVSLENLDASVNETLLWHGTTPELADIISRGAGFEESDGVLGKGIYLSEEIGSSFSNCTADGEGTVFVLLCRAVCGDLFFTEEADSGLTQEAAAQGRNAVLAHLGNPTRIYVLMRGCQVYPEFILRIKYTAPPGALPPTGTVTSIPPVPPSVSTHSSAAATGTITRADSAPSGYISHRKDTPSVGTASEIGSAPPTGTIASAMSMPHAGAGYHAAAASSDVPAVTWHHAATTSLADPGPPPTVSVHHAGTAILDDGPPTATFGPPTATFGPPTATLEGPASTSPPAATLDHAGTAALAGSLAERPPRATVG
eukprot:TRINITY_DN6801_c0_g1_i1.p1 TRINITY_DN6801_c0_g1~~TRINITY_DN6801_c0_g1_i1.p1  ORF type:complete len:775 (-),score=113.21 TRINITY_DN6801_c0_g1_i1:7-2052(-)